MINPELIKLVGILMGGVIVLVVGFIFQQKKLKEKNKDPTYTTSEYMSENERKAKTFIENYKSQFSREALTNSLKQINMSDNEIQTYLNKYY